MRCWASDKNDQSLHAMQADRYDNAERVATEPFVRTIFGDAWNKGRDHSNVHGHFARGVLSNGGSTGRPVRMRSTTETLRLQGSDQQRELPPCIGARAEYAKQESLIV
jgi:hypothetical protein